MTSQSLTNINDNHIFNNQVKLHSTSSLLKLLRQLIGGGGGVNQLLLCLNNFKSINTFLIFLQVIINII
jgi:hypothetical protein